MLDLTDKDYVNFYNALKFTIHWEDGYVNDPDDPGGETKWGIAKKFHPNEDIKNLTPERAAEIYYDQYWKTSGAGNLSQPLSTVVFDTAVLCGPGRAIGWLRESGGDIPRFCDLRRQFHLARVKQKPSQEKFLRGWLTRVQDLLKFSELWT